MLLLYSIVLPVQNDQGFLSDDMVLVGGQLDHPVQEQGEQGGLRQDVAGGYQPCATTPSQVSTSIRIRIQRPSGSKSGYGSGFRSRYLKQLLLTSNQDTVLSNHNLKKYCIFNKTKLLKISDRIKKKAESGSVLKKGVLAHRPGVLTHSCNLSYREVRTVGWLEV